MEKLMNKMDDMEMDKVSGGTHDASALSYRPRHFPLHDSNANSMVATRGLPPVGHKMKDFDANSMAANVDETQNASACVGK